LLIVYGIIYCNFSLPVQEKRGINLNRIKLRNGDCYGGSGKAGFANKNSPPDAKSALRYVCKKGIVTCLQSIGSYWGHSLTLPLPEPIASIGSIQRSCVVDMPTGAMQHGHPIN
jgi:hypothetical protein